MQTSHNTSSVERPDIYLALIAELSHTSKPTSIMCVTLIALNLFSWHATSEAIFAWMAVIGGLASAIKVTCMQVHKARRKYSRLERPEAQFWEIMHIVTTTVIAASVGASVSRAFLVNEQDVKLLCVAMLFGYAAGVVARLYVRPGIACLALCLAVPPSILTALYTRELSNQILAGMFLLFLLGGIDTIRHAYKTAIRNIKDRLEMARLAEYDPLTGLANHRGLVKAFKLATHSTEPFVLHCLDLDRFKAINDTHGHSAGDALLKEVASRIQGVVRSTDTVARLGGDEFVVLQAPLLKAEDATALAARITQALGEPFWLFDQTLQVEIGASLGYAHATPDSALEALMDRADQASYAAKRQGGNLYAEFQN